MLRKKISKKLIENLPLNTIRIKIREIRKQKRNLRRLPRHTMSCTTPISVSNTISLALTDLPVPMVLAVSAVGEWTWTISSLCLEIFSVVTAAFLGSLVLGAPVDKEDKHNIEELILGLKCA